MAAAKKRKSASAPPSSQSRKSESKPEKSPEESHDFSEPRLTGAIAETEESALAEAQPLQLSPGELEEEADQEGAFNPETGEINWDCPCLGGMAHGPCGPDFREAFSCFVYSTEEPKGMDCIDKFKCVYIEKWFGYGAISNISILRNMQDCFRLHPEIYGSELDEDEVDEQLKDHIAAEDAKKSNPSEETASDATAPENQEHKSPEPERRPAPEDQKSEEKGADQ